MRRLRASACFVFLIHRSLGLVQPKEDKLTFDDEDKELAFMHVPYNFGHTIEKVAGFGNGMQANMFFGANMFVNLMSMMRDPVKWERPDEEEIPMTKLSANKKRKAANLVQKVGPEFGSDYENMMEAYEHLKKYAGIQRVKGKKEVWGAMDPILAAKSEVGCPLYLTPQKHWPRDIAAHYFGNKTIFGLVRDPLERLVAIFRGSIGGETGGYYGGDYRQFWLTCDVNQAINKMMKEYIKNRYDDPFTAGCTFVPQVDYLEGKYGIAVPVDNRRFPMSLNNLLKKNGYSFTIKAKDILHVTGCPQAWAGSITPETRSMVKMVYKQDYDFICTTFGYCQADESTCLKYISGMCPENMTLAPKPLFELPGGFEIFNPFMKAFSVKSPYNNNFNPWAALTTSGVLMNKMSTARNGGATMGYRGLGGAANPWSAPNSLWRYTNNRPSNYYSPWASATGDGGDGSGTDYDTAGNYGYGTGGYGAGGFPTGAARNSFENDNYGLNAADSFDPFADGGGADDGNMWSTSWP